jgi:hypothetical protein
MGSVARHRAPAARTYSAEEIERALTFVAYIVSRHGEVYMPIFDFLERELLNARAKDNPMARVQRVLQAGAIDVTVNAIR